MVRTLWLSCMICFVACGPQDDGFFNVFSLTFNFSDDAQGWSGDFADYPADDSAMYELIFGHDTLPANLNSAGNRKALVLSGINYSDDLFMFIKRKITGLKPNAVYAVLFNIQLASDAPTGAVGIGGPPGEAVILKAGLVREEPRKIRDVEGYYRMNIDKGNQSLGGADMMVLGHIGVAPNTTQFTIINRNNTSANPFLFHTDASGEGWLIMGTDSGFEGRTTLYYVSVTVLFNEQ